MPRPARRLTPGRRRRAAGLAKKVSPPGWKEFLFAPMLDLQALAPLIKEHFDWAGWEALIKTSGVTIDRPHGSTHPAFPEILYPMDYGYVNGTVAGDGHEVDVFVGTADTRLVGALLTTDHRRGDREIKLLFDCTPTEVYLAHGFVNFDRRLMEGVLVLRQSMRALWKTIA